MIDDFDKIISAGAHFHQSVMKLGKTKLEIGVSDIQTQIQSCVTEFCNTVGSNDVIAKFGFEDVHIAMGRKWHTQLAFVRINGRNVSFSFHDLLLLHDEPDAGLIFVAKSWVLLIILIRMLTSKELAAKCQFVFEIGDGSSLDQVCFTSSNPEACIIVDYDFTLSNGYRRFRETSVSAPSWEDRIPKIFWRGSTTGGRINCLSENGPVLAPGFSWLQRLHLCSIVSGDPALKSISDIGISAIVQIPETELVDEIVNAGFMRERVPRERFMDFKYVIDVDGNANAWSGLFCSLLGGSLVFKVKSHPTNVHMQWYYDRLVPWLNYIPVSHDFSDLLTKLNWAIAHDSHAKEIAARGRELAMSISMDSAITESATRLKRWIDVKQNP